VVERVSLVVGRFDRVVSAAANARPRPGVRVTDPIRAVHGPAFGGDPAEGSRRREHHHRRERGIGRQIEIVEPGSSGASVHRSRRSAAL
jgi:hypothetical protein